MEKKKRWDVYRVAIDGWLFKELAQIGAKEMEVFRMKELVEMILTDFLKERDNELGIKKLYPNHKKYLKYVGE